MFKEHRMQSAFDSFFWFGNCHLRLLIFTTQIGRRGSGSQVSLIQMTTMLSLAVAVQVMEKFSMTDSGVCASFPASLPPSPIIHLHPTPPPPTSKSF